MSKIMMTLAVVAIMGAGAASFVLTRSADQPHGRGQGHGHQHRFGALSSWLELDSQQQQAIEQADPTFHDEAAGLKTELQNQREALAALLEQPDSSDADVLAQVERVNAANNKLELRVAKHLLKIRPHLSPDQRSRLSSLCAQGVREGGGRQWRGGRQNGGGGGRGPGGGRGSGGGYRGGRGGGGGNGPGHTN